MSGGRRHAPSTFYDSTRVPFHPERKVTEQAGRTHWQADLRSHAGDVDAQKHSGRAMGALHSQMRNAPDVDDDVEVAAPFQQREEDPDAEIARLQRELAAKGNRLVPGPDPVQNALWKPNPHLARDLDWRGLALNQAEQAAVAASSPEDWQSRMLRREGYSTSEQHTETRVHTETRSSMVYTSTPQMVTKVPYKPPTPLNPVRLTEAGSELKAVGSMKGESTSAVEAMLSKLHQKLRTSSQLFHCADENRDDRLTVSEFSRGLAMVGIRPIPSKQQAEQLFEALDVNGDGWISYQELMDASGAAQKPAVRPSSARGALHRQTRTADYQSRSVPHMVTPSHFLEEPTDEDPAIQLTDQLMQLGEENRKLRAQIADAPKGYGRQESSEVEMIEIWELRQQLSTLVEEQERLRSLVVPLEKELAVAESNEKAAVEKAEKLASEIRESHATEQVALDNTEAAQQRAEGYRAEMEAMRSKVVDPLDAAFEKHAAEQAERELSDAQAELTQAHSTIQQLLADKAAQMQNESNTKDGLESLRVVDAEQMERLKAQLESLRTDHEWLTAERDELVSSLSEKCSGLDGLQAELEAARTDHKHEEELILKEIHEKEVQLEALRQELDSLRTENEGLVSSLDDKSAAHDRLQAELESLKVQLEEISKRAINASSTVELELQQRVTDQAKAANEWEASKSQLTGRVEQLQAERDAGLADSGAAHERLKAELEALRTEHEGLGAVRDELVVDLTAMGTAHEQLEALRTDHEWLTAERDELASSLSQKSTAHEGLKAELYGLFEDQKVLRAANDGLVVDLSAKSTAHDGLVAELERAKAELESLHTEHEALGASKDGVVAELFAEGTSHEALKVEMQALRTSAVDPLDVAFEKQLSDQAEQELNELRTENEGLVSLLSVKSTAHDKLKSQLESLRTDQEWHGAIKDERDALVSSFDEQSASHNRLQAELESLKVQVESSSSTSSTALQTQMEAKLNSMRTDHKHEEQLILREVAEMEMAKQAAEAEIARLRAALDEQTAASSSAISDLSTAATDAEQELKATVDQLEAMSREHVTLKGTKDGLETELEALRASMGSMPVFSAAEAEGSSIWSSTLQTHLQAKDVATLAAEAQAVYAAADVNGDGRLSKSEMKKVIQRDEGLRGILVEGGWKAFFAVLDRDGDGTIDLEEFTNFYINKLRILGQVTLGSPQKSPRSPSCKNCDETIPGDESRVKCEMGGFCEAFVEVDPLDAAFEKQLAEQELAQAKAELAQAVALTKQLQLRMGSCSCGVEAVSNVQGKLLLYRTQMATTAIDSELFVELQAQIGTMELQLKGQAQSPSKPAEGSDELTEFEFGRRVFNCLVAAPGVGYRHTPNFADKVLSPLPVLGLDAMVQNRDGRGPQDPEVIIADRICQGPKAVFVRCVSGAGWLPLSTPDGKTQVFRHLGPEAELNMADYKLVDGQCKTRRIRQVVPRRGLAKDHMLNIKSKRSNTSSPRSGTSMSQTISEQVNASLSPSQGVRGESTSLSPK